MPLTVSLGHNVIIYIHFMNNDCILLICEAFLSENHEKSSFCVNYTVPKLIYSVICDANAIKPQWGIDEDGYFVIH